MKKLYTIALAALTCFAATSAPTSKSTDLKAINNPVAAVESSAVGSLKIAKATKATAKNVSAADFEGEYQWTAYTLLDNTSDINRTITIEITDPATGKASISNYYSNATPLECTIDASNGTISIPTGQDLGLDSGDIFYLKEADSEGKVIAGASSATAAVGTIKGRTITFPELEIWAFGNPQKENLGWWMLCYANVFAEPERWIKMSNAKFKDGLVAPSFNITINEESEVDLYKSETNEGMYRLDNPWAALFGKLGVNATSPSLMLDAKDPKNVLIELTSTNINGGEEDGIYYFLSYSFLSSLNNAETPDNLKIALKKEENKMIFDFPQYSCLIFASTSGDLIQAALTPSQITFDASASDSSVIEDITVEEQNTPVEYFNLQGMRVDTPAAGQVVIKRQGNKATKIVVK